ncbi:MAG: LysE family transporter [Pseudomonadota bacterium]
MDNVTALILFALAATLSPGGATTMATSSGARFGYRRSLPLIFGIAFALAGLTCLSVAGLSSALIGVPILAVSIKSLGTVYLLWLALQIATSGRPGHGDLADETPMTFLAAALLLIVNPKAWAMGMGVASFFAETSASAFVFGAILATIFATCAGVSLSFWVLTGSFVARILTTRTHWAVFNGAISLLLLAAIAQLWW